jgi:hypothetical protein
MAFDEALAEEIRTLLCEEEGFSEKKMFGGLCFLIHGHMTCGVGKGFDLMLRVGPDQHEECLALEHARPMDFTGRPMKGMVFVDRPGWDSPDALRGWIDYALRFVRTLPPKN